MVSQIWIANKKYRNGKWSGNKKKEAACCLAGLQPTQLNESEERKDNFGGTGHPAPFEFLEVTTSLGGGMTFG